LFQQHESGLPVHGQRGGMIQRAGVQPEAFRPVAPCGVDRPLQEPPAEPLAGELIRILF
jgi:hypothetical protein